MGLVLIPFFLGAFIIFVKAIFQLYYLNQGNDLTTLGMSIGILIPILIIIFTMISWIKKGKLYAFHPHFFLPIHLMYLPIGIYLLLKIIPYYQGSVLVNSILTIWIVFSGLIMIPLLYRVSTFLKKKGVKFYY